MKDITLQDQLDQEREARIANDKANMASLDNSNNQIGKLNQDLSTEVIHRSEGDLLSNHNYEALNSSIQQRISDMLSSYANLRSDNKADITKLAELLTETTRLINLSINTTNSRLLDEEKNRSTQYTAMSKDIKKYLEILSDITMDSTQITMDNGEIRMGAWTILSQARSWDLDIIKQLKQLSSTVGSVAEATDALTKGDANASAAIIEKMIEALSNSKIIVDLDNILKDVDNRLSTEIAQIKKDSLDRVAAVDKIASDIRKSIEQAKTETTTLMDTETNERLVAITKEANTRKQQVIDINSNADALSAHVDVQVIDIKKSVQDVKDNADKIFDAQGKAIVQINNDIDSLRTSSSNQTNNAIAEIRKEIDGVKEGTTTSFNEVRQSNKTTSESLESYKVSTNNSLTAIINKQTTLTDESKSTVEKLNGVVTDIADPNTGLKAVGSTASSAMSKAELATNSISQTNQTLDALSSKVLDPNKGLEATANQLSSVSTLANKTESSTNVLTQKVDSISSTLTEQGTGLKTVADATNTLTTKVNKQDESITSLTQSNQRLQNSIDTKASSEALNAVKSSVDSQGNDIKSAQSSIASLSGSVGSLDSATKANANNISTVSNNLEQTNQGLATQARRTDQVEATVKSNSSNIASNSSALNTLTVQVNNLGGEVATKASIESFRELTTRVDNNFTGLKDVYASKADWSGSRGDLTQELTSNYTKAISLLSAGGRNLILDSDRSANPISFLSPDHYYSVFGFKASNEFNNKKVTKGTYVAVSIWYKARSEAFGFNKPFSSLVLGYPLGGDGWGIRIYPSMGSITSVGDMYKWSGKIQLNGDNDYIFGNSECVFIFEDTSSTTGMILYKVKIELGSIFTEWTPAPEDVQSTLDSQASLISTRYTKAEANNATAQAINNFNANMQIGGRNLLVNSKGPFTPDASTTDNWKEYPDSRVNLVKGQEYTLSAQSNVNFTGTHGQSNARVITLWIIGRGENGAEWINDVISIDSGTSQVRTFTWLKNSGTYHIRVNSYVTSNDVYAEYIKIEKGSKATDWTYALEDRDAALNNISANIKDLTNVQVTQNSAVTTRLNQAESTLSAHGSSIQNLTTTYAKKDEVGSIAQTHLNSIYVNKDELQAYKSDVSTVYATKSDLNSTSNNLTNVLNSSTDNKISNALVSYATKADASSIASNALSEYSASMNGMPDNIVRNPYLLRNMDGYSAGVRLLGDDRIPGCPTNAALLITTRDTFYGDWFPVVAGQTYYISAQVARRNSSDHSFNMGLMLYKESYRDPIWYGVFSVGKVEVNKWGSYSGTLRVPDGYIQGRVWLQHSAWFDEDTSQEYFNVTNMYVTNSSATPIFDESKFATATALNQTNVNVERNSAGLATKAESSTVQQLQSTVANNMATVVNDYATKNSLQDSVASINQRINTSYQDAVNNTSSYVRNYAYSRSDADSATARYIQEFNSSLEVGGKNLQPNSDFSRNNLDYWYGNGGEFTIITDDSKFGTAVLVKGDGGNGLYIVDPNGWEVNQKYTVSIYLKDPTTSINFGVEGATYHSRNSEVITQVNGQWVRYTLTFTKTHWSGAVVVYLNSNGQYYLTRAKLEKGTKATDWSESPTDNQLLVARVDSKLTNFQDTQARTNESVANRLSTTEANFSGASGRISNIESSYAKSQDVGTLARRELISVYTNGVNLCRKKDVLEGWLNGGNVENSGGDWTVNTWFPTSEGSPITGTVYDNINANSVLTMQVSYYDSNKNYIHNRQLGNINKNIITVTAPSGAAYFRVSYPKAFYGLCKIEQGAVSTPYSVPLEDGASQSDLSAWVSQVNQSFATKSDWSGTKADLITDIKSKYVPGSGNLLQNPDFSANTPFYAWGYSDINGSSGLNIWYNKADWGLNDSVSRTAYLYSPTLSNGKYDEIWQDFSIVGGKSYQISAYTGAHRCTAVLFVYFYDTNGHDIGVTFDADPNTRNNQEAAGGRDLGGYKRIYKNFTAPANAVRAKFTIRRDYSGGGDPYLFITRTQALEIPSTDAPLATWTGNTTVDMSKLIDTSIIQNYATNASLNEAKASITTQLQSRYDTGGGSNKLFNSDFTNGLDGWHSNGSHNNIEQRGDAYAYTGTNTTCKIVSGNPGGQGLYRWVDTIPVGTRCTYSIWVYGEGDSVGIGLDMCTETMNIDSDTPSRQAVKAGWNRYIVRGTWRNTGNAIAYFDCWRSGQVFWVARPQLELGNVATDWKPNNADVYGRIANSEATIMSNVYTKAEADRATSSKVDELRTTVNSSSATIQSLMQTYDGNKAVGGIRIDNNGNMSGIGLLSEMINGQVRSAVSILADAFTVGNGNNKIKPFIVTADGQWIDGVNYPAGIWANMATFANASIGDAKIANLNASKLTAGIISADRIGARTITVDKLTVGDLTNLWSNRYLEDGKPSIGDWDSWIPPMGKCRIIRNRDNITDWNNRVEVKEGDVIVTEFDGQPDQSKRWLNAGMWVTDENNNYPNGAGAWQAASVYEIKRYDNSLWRRYRSVITIAGSNAMFGRLYFQQDMPFDDYSSIWHVANITQTRGVKGELIVNGSITGDHVQAKTINADKLNINDLSAITANLGSIKVGSANIEDLSVDTLKIKDRAINNPYAIILSPNINDYDSVSSRTYTFDLWGLSSLSNTANLSIFFRADFESKILGLNNYIDSGTIDVYINSTKLFTYKSRLNTLITMSSDGSDGGGGRAVSEVNYISITSLDNSKMAFAVLPNTSNEAGALKIVVNNAYNSRIVASRIEIMINEARK